MAFLKKLSITHWIFIALVAGIIVGNVAPDVAKNMDIFSKIFLKLIKTIVAPLLFATLIIGIAGHADMKQVGRMGWKSLLYFEIVTTLALFFGLVFANWIRPGDGVDLTAIQATGEKIAVAKQDWKDIILHTFPENIAKSVAEGQVLQIVVFAIFFALGLAMVTSQKHKTIMLDWTESLAEVMFKFTKLVMYFAPIGVFGAMAYAIGKLGNGALWSMAKLLLTVYGALAAFLLLVLLPVMLLFRIKILKFLKAVLEPVTIAFGTASSEAALAPAMQRLEAYGVPRKFVSFVLPTGMSFNLDGSTLYLATAAIFVAQAQGIELSIGQQITMLLTLMLTSKGVAGVARASLVILMGTIAMFGLSDTPVYLILAVDVLMDMVRTGVNMLGNCLATVVVAKWENEFDD
jgi:proton glutamate symport protein